MRAGVRERIRLKIRKRAHTMKMKNSKNDNYENQKTVSTSNRRWSYESCYKYSTHNFIRLSYCHDSTNSLVRWRKNLWASGRRRKKIIWDFNYKKLFFVMYVGHFTEMKIPLPYYCRFSDPFIIIH